MDSSCATQQFVLTSLDQPPRYSEQPPRADEPPEGQSQICSQQPQLQQPQLQQLQVNLQHPDYLKPVTPPSYDEATSQGRPFPPIYPLWRPTADLQSQGLVYPCGDHGPSEICVYCATPTVQRRVLLRRNLSSNSWQSGRRWQPTWLKIAWIIFLFAFISTSLSFVCAFVYADFIPMNGA